MLWENKIGENKEQLELFEKYVNNKTVKDIEFMKTLSLISVASAQGNRMKIFLDFV